MAYDYYRNSGSGWGTSQFQFASPPAPPFRPQSSWGGMDYYNAHAVNPDPSLFHSVMSRTGQGSVGLGRREARYWHRRVYSGMSPLTQLLPVDIGAAAAYEAYRTWKHNSFLHEPLSSDPLRMREGLVGMAIAETTRLWQYAGRPMDTFGLRAASEAAASVATVLSERLMEWTGGGAGALPSGGSGLGGGYRPRRSSFHVPSVIRSGGALGIPAGPPTMTAGGMGGVGMGFGGGSSRASSVIGVGGGGGGLGYSPSMSPSPMPGMMAGGGMGANVMGGAMGGGMGGAMGGGMGGMGGGGMTGGMGGGGMGGGFAPGPMPVPGAGSGMGAGAGMGGAAMEPGAMGASGMLLGGAYGTGGLGAGGGYGAGAGQYGGASAGAYGGAPGGAVPFPGGGQAQQPGSTVIIQDDHERSHRRPRARRYSDSYTDRPRRRRSPSFERPPVGYGAGGGYAGVGAGGGYGAGAPGMGGGGYGAGGGMYGAGAGTGMGGVGMGGAGMGGAGMAGPGMGGAYGAGSGMGGAYGAQGAYGGAPGYGGMSGGAGGYGGMPGAYGGSMAGSSASGYGGERGRGFPGGPFSRAREAAEEEESEEEEEMGGGRFGGLAQKFRAGMGMGLNATGLGRRGD